MRVKPVLVTGAPRSGTTWIGQMLAESRSLNYIYEPFNPTSGVGKDICGARFNKYFTYITEENEAPYYQHIRNMLESRYGIVQGLKSARTMKNLREALRRYKKFQTYRRQNVVPLIKDPIAIMSAGWLHRRFDINPVVMIRHPAAFVASMKRLDWPFKPSRWALSQQLLMQDFLSSFKAEMEDIENNQRDIVEQACLLWNVIHTVIQQYQTRYPNWIYLRHEDISENPVTEFRKLFAKLDLDFTDDIQATIEKSSSAANPAQAESNNIITSLDSRANIYSWKQRLSDLEIERIKENTWNIASTFYSEADW